MLVAFEPPSIFPNDAPSESTFRQPAACLDLKVPAQFFENKHTSCLTPELRHAC